MAVQVANHRDIRRKQEERKPPPRNVSDRAKADNARNEQNRSLLSLTSVSAFVTNPSQVSSG
jgi:hypothetical protein